MQGERACASTFPKGSRTSLFFSGKGLITEELCSDLNGDLVCFLSISQLAFEFSNLKGDRMRFRLRSQLPSFESAFVSLLGSLIRVASFPH
jgi:hypothetical protein